MRQSAITKALAFVAFMLATAVAAQTDPPPFYKDYGHLLTTGTSWKIALVRRGNASDNSLGGTHLRDVFDAGEGNDLLLGYQGFDTYIFQAGDGADTLIDHSADGNLIRFRDVPEDAVTTMEVPGLGDDMDRLITYGPGDAIRIVGWSRLSEKTRSEWVIEHYFSPKPAPARKRPNPILVLLTNPVSLSLILLCLTVGLLPLVRLWRNRG